MSSLIYHDILRFLGSKDNHYVRQMSDLPLFVGGLAQRSRNQLALKRRRLAFGEPALCVQGTVLAQVLA